MLCIVSSIQQSIASTLECEYTTKTNYRNTNYRDTADSELPAELKDAYTCWGAVSQACDEGDTFDIASVDDNHEGDRRAFDVKIFGFLEGQTIPSMPRNIGLVFKNLIALRLTNVKLEYLSKEDLKEFPNLRHLWACCNKLKVLDADLFQFNPNLISLSFESNEIQSVGIGVLDDLTQLKRISSHSNKCINYPDIVDGNKQNIEALKAELEQKCAKDEDNTATCPVRNIPIELIICLADAFCEYSTRPIQSLSIPMLAGKGELRKTMMMMKYDDRKK